MTILHNVIHFILRLIASLTVDTMCVIHPLFKRKGYLLFDNLDDSSSESNDCFTLFEYLVRTGKRASYITKKESPEYKKAIEKGWNQNLIVISTNCFSLKCFFCLFFHALRYENIVTSHGRINFLLARFWKKSPYCSYIHAQHGVMWFKQSPFKHNLSPLNYDKLVVSSYKEADFAIQYGWEKDNLILSGLFRFDNLTPYTKSVKNKLILVMFTWRHSFDNNEVGSTSITHSIYNHKITNLFKNSKLNNIIKQHGLKVVFIPHHYLIDHGNGVIDFPKNTTIGNIKLVSDYIKEADMLITDYSSVCFDFLYQEKPVIFYHLDFSDDSLQEKDKEEQMFVQKRNDSLFNICDKEGDVVRLVENYSIQNFELEKENKTIANSFFATKSTSCNTFTKLTF